ncbi:unnamed protein product [Schistosoma margrebowiei]|uniref:Uncharacterized protein n=1 Tax=Schistosoma margrebowiei TaxID=48269 RepID=A0A183LB95_9TREM|nr:unnamed protein product [Schistosoma margrebowiei]
MVVGSSRQETLDPSFVLLGTQNLCSLRNKYNNMYIGNYGSHKPRKKNTTIYLYNGKNKHFSTYLSNFMLC